VPTGVGATASGVAVAGVADDGDGGGADVLGRVVAGLAGAGERGFADRSGRGGKKDSGSR
jgi:hypothetical protein